MSLSPSSSLRSPANSADSEREANDVRLEEPDEAWLGGRLPISLLIQCSHKEELVDPNVPNRQRLNMYNIFHTATFQTYIRDCTNIIKMYLPQNYWQTKMELWHVFDKTRCNHSACRPHLQIWAEHRYHQSNTTVHQWSSYSELQDTTQQNIINVFGKLLRKQNQLIQQPWAIGC